MNTRLLLVRSQDLRQQAAITDTPAHHEFAKHHRILQERDKAIRLLLEFETMVAAMTKEFVGLEARVFELAGLAVRGPSGHDWARHFPDRTSAVEFRQKLTALVDWAAERSKQSQTSNHEDSQT